jgi:hypothetical protein
MKNGIEDVDIGYSLRISAPDRRTEKLIVTTSLWHLNFGAVYRGTAIAVRCTAFYTAR